MSTDTLMSAGMGLDTPYQMGVSVFSYLSSSRFIEMILTSDGFLEFGFRGTEDHGDGPLGSRVIHQKDFLADTLQDAPDPNLGVPTHIRFSGFKLRLDEERPHVKLGELELVWRDEFERVHRNKQPARIVVRNYCAFMDNLASGSSDITEFKIDGWCFEWFHESIPYRARGPHTVLGAGYHGIRGNDGLWPDLSNNAAQEMTWVDTSTARTITYNECERLYDATGVLPRFLAEGDDVFQNEGEYMLFLMWKPSVD